MRLPVKRVKKVYVKDDPYFAFIQVQKLPISVAEHLEEVDKLISETNDPRLTLYRKTIFFKYVTFNWNGFKDASLRDLDFRSEYAILFDSESPDLYPWLLMEYDIFIEECNA